MDISLFITKAMGLIKICKMQDLVPWVDRDLLKLIGYGAPGK